MPEDSLHRGRHDAPATAADLGEDIIEAEILPRLPVESLLRFKTVCRSWRALISGPSFAAAHLKQSKSSRKLAVVPFEEGAISLFHLSQGSRDRPARLFGMELDDESKGTFTRVQHSNGLLLMGTRRELAVCNPSTREHALLPQGSRCAWDFLTFPSEHGKAGLGFVAGDNVYKAARYFYRRRGSQGFEVLTLGADPCWRAAAEDPPCPIDPRHSPVSAGGGAVYFKIDKRRHEPPEELVLAFDLRSERFAVIPPPPRHVHDSEYRLQELEGALCFIEMGGDGHEVWTYGGEGWSHAFTVGFSAMAWEFDLVGAMRGGKAVLCTQDIEGREGIACYDTASKSLADAAEVDEGMLVRCGGSASAKDRHLCWSYSVGLHVISYVESLLPVPCGRPDVTVPARCC